MKMVGDRVTAKKIAEAAKGGAGVALIEPRYGDCRMVARLLGHDPDLHARDLRNLIAPAGIWEGKRTGHWALT